MKLKQKKRHTLAQVALKLNQVLILEYAVSPSQGVDKVAGIIRGVKIVGLKSKNGRDYPSEVLQDAIPQYEGSPVYMDHPPGYKNLPKITPISFGENRKLGDHFGIVENVRHEPTGLYGDLRVRMVHPMASDILEQASTSPHDFGLSHNVIAEMGLGDERNVVKKINRVRSVDLVSNPATNNGLFEGVNTMLKDSLPIEDNDDPSQDPLLEACNMHLSRTDISIDEKVDGVRAILEKRDEVDAILKPHSNVDSGSLALKKVERMERRQRAQTMLMEACVPETTDLLDVLSELQSDTSMKKLIMSLPKKQVAPQRRFAITESTTSQKPGKELPSEFLKALRN